MYAPEVKRWNEVMGNAPLTTDTAEQILAKIKRQSAFVVEEAKEIQDGAAVGCIREILDGYLDTHFVNSQIGVYLEALGVDINGAWAEVCASNDTKFSTNHLEMKRSAIEVSQKQGFTHVAESPVPGVFVLKRDVDGKIMKPNCFREPNLTPFIPSKLLKGE
ncbi:MAG: putative pyrophosphohydrolase [Caudoviricetes sp.]|nr:MAG: putative pyrophosphohydrolase [Caudoviricetes sp.]